MAETPKQEDIDDLMRALGADPGKVAPPSPARPPAAAPDPKKPPGRMELEPLASPAPGPRAEAGLDTLNDVDVSVRIELGHAKLTIQEVLKLGSGSVVPLDSQIGDPINVFVNDRLLARGEVLVVNDNFAIRITEVVPPPKSEK
jgi:flagellar motor switch protein FliN